MTEQTKLKSGRKPGDVFIGIGTVIAVLAFALIVISGGGATLFVWAFFIAGLAAVIVGYLQRITAALESR